MNVWSQIEHACRAFNGLVPGYGSNFTVGWPDDNYLALGSKCITNTSRTNPYTVFDPVVTETLGEARLVTYVDGCVAYEQGGDPTEVHAYSRSRTYDQDGDMVRSCYPPPFCEVNDRDTMLRNKCIKSKALGVELYRSLFPCRNMQALEFVASEDDNDKTMLTEARLCVFVIGVMCHANADAVQMTTVT